MDTVFPKRTATALAIVCLFLALIAGAGPALAASTDWQDLGGGKARLVASLDPVTMQVSGVVEFRLDEGWKTYWREPGASGIPPQFDFTGSRQFGAGEVAFPVPEHIRLSESEFVGYHGLVRFVFEGMATDAGGDGTIHLALLAGVCEEICIPATAEFELTMRELMVSDPQADETIAEARLLLPGEPSSGFRVESARLAGNSLEIAATVPDQDGVADLFVEGPAGWRLLPAKPAGRQGRQVSFRLDLSELPPDARPDETMLRFTLTSKGKGIEQRLKPTP